MPAPTEQRAQDQRSDAERADAAYYHSKILQTALGMFIHDGGTTPLEKACARMLKLRLNDKVTEFGGSTWRGDIFASVDADRDRQMVEAMREAFDEMQRRRNDLAEPMSVLMAALILTASTEHKRIYGTPCAAKEKA